ncbi:MAG TPA: hypothetical protein EYN67_17805 [Flavobacteriales bacterium]|nr:hypothetical protein [Flavobacteriales bacterium]
MKTVMADNGELPEAGSQYLDEDGQLCAALVNHQGFVIGEMLEHSPISEYPVISTSRFDRIKPIDTRTDKEKDIDEACLIIGDSKRCVDTNINIDCSVAQKAVIITMINNGYRKVGE